MRHGCVAGGCSKILVDYIHIFLGHFEMLSGMRDVLLLLKRPMISYSWFESL